MEIGCKKNETHAKIAKCKLCKKDITNDHGIKSNLQWHFESKHKSECEDVNLKKKM